MQRLPRRVPTTGSAPALAFAVVVLLAAAAPLTGQAVRGRVLDDETGAPVSAAAVRLLIDDTALRSTETDDAGRFILPVMGAADVRLEVERLGYRTARSQPFAVERDDTVSVEFRVLPEAVLLMPLTVTAHSTAGRSLFARRRDEWGQGIFRGPEALDSLNPTYVGEIFKDMEKVWLSWSWGRASSGATGPVPAIRTFMGRGCMLYMVDRVPVRLEPWESGSDWLGYQLGSLRPEDIVALEVYRYAGEAPPELRRYASQTRSIFTDTGIKRVDRDLCGLAVIWTKAGW